MSFSRLICGCDIAVVVAALLAACGESVTDPEDRPDPPIHTPYWAFAPWISKDISSTDDTRAFVSGFREREIPVGAVVLDSPWETNYNSFVPHPVRYHDFFDLVGELHAANIRVVCWTTQMLNDDSFDLEPGGDTYPPSPPMYREALAKGYFVNEGQKWFWWKGTGGAIDFFDREGVRWWHRQTDQVLAPGGGREGIDGWKLDFGDSYVMSATVGTDRGVISHQEYSEAYYRDFFAYGVHTRGPEFLTMVRGYDKSYQFEGRFFAKKEHAPVVWMGDNRRDFIGLADALDHLFRSSRAGYVVGGTDIGGYLDRDDTSFTDLVPFSSVVFARWTSVAALTPFMQLHGRANIAPWTVPDRAEEIVDVYRYWAVLHHELAPFFYSFASDAHEGRRGPIVEPIGEEAEWVDDYRFTSGEVFLVAPILEERGVRDVALPAGARWYDWWSRDVFDGGGTVTASVSRDLLRVPLFVREGAIVPFRGGGARAVLGDRTRHAEVLGIAIWPADQETTFSVRASETAEPFLVTASKASVTISKTPEAIVLRVRADRAPVSVLDDGAPAAGVRFDDTSPAVWIELAARDAARTVTLRFE